MPDIKGPVVIDSADGSIIATMNGFGSDAQYLLACKFAAAPELYEALLLVENVKELPIRDRDIIKAALAKARGE